MGGKLTKVTEGVDTTREEIDEAIEKAEDDASEIDDLRSALEGVPEDTDDDIAALKAQVEQSGVSGVLSAHSSFWRQLNRRGLFTGESFHLFYEYNPQRRVGSKLRIGLRFDTQQEGDTFIRETIASSALSPFYHLKPLITRRTSSAAAFRPCAPIATAPI